MEEFREGEDHGEGAWDILGVGGEIGRTTRAEN